MTIGNYIFICFVSFSVLIIILEILHKVTIEWKNTIQDTPNNWRWGIIYFNPNDQRVIVPKRVHVLGWTLNMAQPASLIFLSTLLLIIVLSAIL
jgi:uncharacterized membrane protein